MSENLYALEYFENVIKVDIPALPKSIKIRIRAAIEERLAVDPIGFGKPLQYAWRGHRRLRVGDYRVIYRIDQEKRHVIIVAVAHRKDVYE